MALKKIIILCVTLALLLVNPCFPLTAEQGEAAEENIWKTLVADLCSAQKQPPANEFARAYDPAEKACSSAFKSYKLLPPGEQARCPEAHTPKCEDVKNGCFSKASRKCSVSIPTQIMGQRYDKPIAFEYCTKAIINRRQSIKRKQNREAERKKKQDERNWKRTELQRKKEEARKAEKERRKQMCSCNNCQGLHDTVKESESGATQPSNDRIKNNNSGGENKPGILNRPWNASDKRIVVQAKDLTWCPFCPCPKCHFARVKAFGRVDEPLTSTKIIYTDGRAEYTFV